MQTDTDPRESLMPLIAIFAAMVGAVSLFAFVFFMLFFSI
jgi:F0F1-type ATP synthase membrane subunit c/vacuolar-type H+-ATPase subunit K